MSVTPAIAELDNEEAEEGEISDLTNYLDRCGELIGLVAEAFPEESLPLLTSTAARLGTDIHITDFGTTAYAYVLLLTVLATAIGLVVRTLDELVTQFAKHTASVAALLRTTVDLLNRRPPALTPPLASLLLTSLEGFCLWLAKFGDTARDSTAEARTEFAGLLSSVLALVPPYLSAGGVTRNFFDFL